MENKFISVVQSLQLTDIETAALRLAIARDDANVRRAIDAYRLTQSEAMLKQDLVAVARETIRLTLEEGDDDDDDDDEAGEEEDDEGEEEDVEEPERRGGSYGSPHKSSPLTKASPGVHSSPVKASPLTKQASPVHSSPVKTSPYKNYEFDQAEDVTEDDDEDDGEEEDDEDGVEKNLSSTEARRHVFPILLNELVKEKFISNRAGEALLKLFTEGNAKINAALDMHDRTHSMERLLGELQQILEEEQGH